MEEIFKQYATPIIIAIVIVALIAIVGFLLAESGLVQGMFEDMLENFSEKSGLEEGTG